ncbi:hypothetical protein PVNG_05002 [Plasmodium vivax North Korean]|uniref:VIR protein n=1 Tax=Plasmodium vivax North Korean TaxID=1035514 RepID=A0A0J9TZY3_PLAVI|nr:hypothetical protein PVNG_05002 [Plasmodium vivax North Korean]
MGEILGQSELDLLNTINNYNSFDKDKNNCAFYPRVIEAKHRLDGHFWKNNISDQLLNALCYVYIREKNKTKNENLCNYLYYWLGSKVLTNLRLKYFFFEVIKEIYDILSEGEPGKVCNRVEYSIYHDNFHKYKLVYDLSEDYNTYKSHFIKPNPSCDKDYEDAIKSYKLLYKKLRNECTIERTNYYDHYCDVFNKYFTQDKNDEISSWTCKLRETDKQDQQLEKEPREEAPKKHIQEELTAGRVRIQEDSYAPARSWINKLLGMNKITNRNPYANQELMADFYQPEDFYSERDRYNIMYNPE